MMRSIKILCIGEEWRGSNASGLFYAFSRLDCLVKVVNELQYISVHANSTVAKGFNRAIRRFQIDDFNDQLRYGTKSFKPDLVLVYKGAFIEPDVIQDWKGLGIPVVNFFPDVSFLAHGAFIPKCVSLYDHIFTTKSFGASDLHNNFGIDQARVTFIPHGFDPTIHRKILLNNNSEFVCDASFIGGFTPNKFKYLTRLSEASPSLSLRIWGNGWNGKKSECLKKAIQGQSIIGDLYVLGINSSKINIALLSERVKGASSGDQITSRTFHIPGSGGFMLHERTSEVLQYFKEDEEMVCFESAEELVDKISYYLKNENERNRILMNGYKRAQADHSIDQRARKVIMILKEKDLIK